MGELFNKTTSVQTCYITRFHPPNLFIKLFFKYLQTCISLPASVLAIISNVIYFLYKLKALNLNSKNCLSTQVKASIASLLPLTSQSTTATSFWKFLNMRKTCLHNYRSWKVQVHKPSPNIYSFDLNTLSLVYKQFVSKILCHL